MVTTGTSGAPAAHPDLVDADSLLSLLANRGNRSILGLLAVEAAYPRKVAGLLSLSETEVSRRMKRMEDLGLVVGEWTYVGKNVKLYRLAVKGARIQIGTAGVHVQYEGDHPRAAASVPLEAPAPDLPEVDRFVGRTRDLEILGGPAAVVLVEGLAGIGKTSLLARFARASAAPAFWHGFRGVESLRWLANRLAVFHAQQGDAAMMSAMEADLEPADLHTLIVQALDDPRFVHVLDDIHRVEDPAVAEVLRDAIAATRHGKLVVGTREPPRHDPTLEHLAVLRLEGLGDDAVAALVAAHGWTPEPSLLARLRQEVGGHPLALNLLLEAAERRDRDLEALLDGIPETETEEYLLREVYDALRDDERQVLTLASLFRTSFTADDLRALSRRDPEHALYTLRRRILLNPTGDRYAMHEIVRNFFYHRLQDKARLHERAARRLLEHDTPDGRLEAMHHLMHAGRKERVLELLEDDLDLREFDFLDASYHNLYQNILDAFSRDEVGDARRWALIEDEKGDIAYHRGDYAGALRHYDQATTAFSPGKDPQRVADLAWKRGLALRRLGRQQEAAAAVEQALPLVAAGTVYHERLDDLRATLEE